MLCIAMSYYDEICIHDFYEKKGWLAGAEASHHKINNNRTPNAGEDKVSSTASSPTRTRCGSLVRRHCGHVIMSSPPIRTSLLVV